MRALDSLQGPIYVGPGCIFRRTVLYSALPLPRATEHHGWFGRKKINMSLRNPKQSKKQEDKVSLPIIDLNDDDADIESLLLPKRFGDSTILAASIPVAEQKGRLLQDLQGRRTHGRPAGSLSLRREAFLPSLKQLVSYLASTRYGSLTEDVVIGYRMHNTGWRSVYCVTKRDAFQYSADQFNRQTSPSAPVGNGFC